VIFSRKLLIGRGFCELIGLVVAFVYAPPMLVERSQEFALPVVSPPAVVTQLKEIDEF